jgi:hypothetical protein
MDCREPRFWAVLIPPVGLAGEAAGVYFVN